MGVTVATAAGGGGLRSAGMPRRSWCSASRAVVTRTAPPWPPDRERSHAIADVGPHTTFRDLRSGPRGRRLGSSARRERDNDTYAELHVGLQRAPRVVFEGGRPRMNHRWLSKVTAVACGLLVG